MTELQEERDKIGAPKYRSWIPKLIGSLAKLTLSFAFLALTVNVVQAKDINKANKITLDRLDHNQAGIDELVNFVHDLEKQQQITSSGPSPTAVKFQELLCSSSDPVRVEACKRLSLSPVPGG